jgi:hypothetical protein
MSSEGGQTFDLATTITASRYASIGTLVPNGPNTTVVKLGNDPEHCFECTKLKVCNEHTCKKTEISVSSNMQIQLTTPVLVINAGQSATSSLILTPLPDTDECSTKLVIINNSSNSQIFGLGGNVKGPNLTMVANTAYEFNWNPSDKLWYACPSLS